jgi:hypothetical protein
MCYTPPSEPFRIYQRDTQYEAPHFVTFTSFPYLYFLKILISFSSSKQGLIIYCTEYLQP